MADHTKAQSARDFSLQALNLLGMELNYSPRGDID
jgi:hypothetical protein